MSTHMLMDKGKVACVGCGADWGNLNPKATDDGEAFYCQCDSCGTEDTYLFPKVCLNCFYTDWEHYGQGDYPEDCPSCNTTAWGT